MQKVLYRCILLFIVVLCSRLSSNGQQYWENYELITTRQGLPHNTVLSLLQDSQGYLWIGTYNGLCRYDGHKYEVYTGIFEKAGGDNWLYAIESIYEDHSGNIWIGTRGGMVSCFVRKQQKFRSFKPDRKLIRTNCFYQDHKGILWIGSDDGLFRVTGDTIRSMGLGTGPVIGIAGADRNSLVLATGEKLFSYTAAHGLQVYTVEGLSKGIEFYSCTARNKELLLLTSAGCITIQLEDRHVRYLLRSPGRRPIYIKPAFSGQGYLTAEALKLKMYNPAHLATDSLHISEYAWNNNHEIHNCLLQDQTGTIWLGTNSGLYKIDKGRYRFKKYLNQNPEHVLGDNYVRSIYNAGKDLWVGTRNGCVNRLSWQPGQHKYVLDSRYPFKNKGSLPDSEYTINCFMQYGADILAGGESGLLHMNRKNGTFFKRYNDLCPPGIWALYCDTASNIWMGTIKHGLCILSASTGKVYSYSGGGSNRYALEARSVWNIYKDRKGILWLGTDSGLFQVQDPHNITDIHFRKYPLQIQDSLPLNIWNITEDSFSNLWVGSTGHGLFQIGASRKQHNILGPYTHNVISALLTDSTGNLWISTVNGLYRYNIRNKHMEEYTEEDGLLSNEFNFKAATVTAEGMLFFGNKTGMISFIPAQIRKQAPDSTPVHIGALFINGRDSTASLYSGKQLILNHDQNHISLHFFIPDFTKPSGHRFRFQLEGFDKEWQESADGHAQYANLPPGSYRFTVTGRVGDANWNDQTAVMLLRIKPVFWQTNFFRISVVLILIILCGAAVYRRVNMVVRREREKNRIEKEVASLELKALQAQMNPHFIFNSINSIQHFIVHNDVLAANDYLTRFARLMRLFLESSKNRYILLQSEVQLLNDYLELELLRFDDRFSYRFTVDKALDTHRILIPPAIIQPFIENAINHGLKNIEGKGKLLISFEQAALHICCIIDDNGVGRQQAAQLRNPDKKDHISRGMQLIEERIKTYNFIDEKNISINIIDKALPLQGTRVEISIPIHYLQ